MATGSYQVIFSGEIIEHADVDMVKSNVARVFSLPADRIEKLFSGRRLVLKKDIDHATAERYKTTLLRAGAKCEVEDTSAAEQSTHEPQQTTSLDEQAEKMSVAAVGSQIGDTVEVVEANINTSGMDMAEVGISLGEPKIVADANIDTGNIDMAEVGITLGEFKDVPEAQIDTSNIDMAEVGIKLAETEEFVEAEFDVSALTMDQPGTTLAESTPIPDADIDTSQLSLD